MKPYTFPVANLHRTHTIRKEQQIWKIMTKPFVLIFVQIFDSFIIIFAVFWNFIRQWTSLKNHFEGAISCHHQEITVVHVVHSHNVKLRFNQIFTFLLTDADALHPSSTWEQILPILMFIFKVSLWIRINLLNRSTVVVSIHHVNDED